MTKRIISNEPTRIAREQHSVSRKNISPNALKVLRRLTQAGFLAYLVGGSVRDLLLGGHPKDFDVATSATPEEVYKLFSNCILIGRRFRLAHIRYGDEIIEVATFRGNPSGAEHEHIHEKSDEGMLLRDNVYGTLEEDAFRRDFTVNALYYDLTGFSIIDYTGGITDIESRTLRIIGEPAQRFREDPVRMLRAIRFMNKLDFSLTSDVEALIPEMADLLGDIPAARLFEEFLKMFMHGHSLRAYQLLEKYGLLYKLFPYLKPILEDEPKATFYRRFFENAFINTDKRIAQEKPVTPAFLLAVLMWPLYLHHLELLLENKKTRITMAHRDTAIDRAFTHHRHHMALPRRFSLMIREMWDLQPRLESPRRKQVKGLLASPRFRAAYDFLLLRSQSGDSTAKNAEWWTQLQEASEDDRLKMTAEIGTGPKKRKRRTKKPTAQENSQNDE
jgi:poly(A) polymerase